MQGDNASVPENTRQINMTPAVTKGAGMTEKKKMSEKEVVILTGAGQIGLAIVRRIAHGKIIVVGDVKEENAAAMAKILTEAGFEAHGIRTDISDRDSVAELINLAVSLGEVKYFVNAAGVSPSQAPIERILKVDLYGTALLLREVGKVIAKGGAGITVSSQSGHRMPALTPEQDKLLAMTPVEELLELEMLQPENIENTLHAYQMAKRCNVKRVMAESVLWGKRGARVNSISPGIIVTPLAIDEFNGPRGDFYKNMFAKCPAGRPGCADEVAALSELMMSDKGAFITGSDFLIDGGATASFFYGELAPKA